MLGLQSKTEKIPGATALTAEEWHRYKATKTGAYQVVGGGAGQEHHTMPMDFATAWEMFRRAARRTVCNPASEFRIKLVPADGDAAKRAAASALLEA